MELGIAHVGLAKTDVQRLKAVMAMAITNDTLAARWCMRETGTADLVIFAPDSPEGQAMAAAGRASRAKVFAVLAGESEHVEVACERLAWPIRLEGLLELLKKVEKRSAAEAGVSEPPPPSLHDSGSHLVRLASLLRDAPESTDGVAWRIDGASRRPLYIVPGRRSFYFGEPLTALRNLDFDVQLDFVPLPIEEVSDKAAAKPIQMLQWLVGLRTGTSGLLPWIDAGSAFKLKKFPEFQILLHTPGHRRIAAILSQPRAGIETIARMTGQDEQVVSGFVNAASLCGYLQTLGRKSAAAPTPKRGDASRRALFRSFRKALGIAVADA